MGIGVIPFLPLLIPIPIPTFYLIFSSHYHGIPILIGIPNLMHISSSYIFWKFSKHGQQRWRESRVEAQQSRREPILVFLVHDRTRFIVMLQQKRKL